MFFYYSYFIYSALCILFYFLHCNPVSSEPTRRLYVLSPRMPFGSYIRTFTEVEYTHRLLDGASSWPDAEPHGAGMSPVHGVICEILFLPRANRTRPKPLATSNGTSTATECRTISWVPRELRDVSRSLLFITIQSLFTNQLFYMDLWFVDIGYTFRPITQSVYSFCHTSNISNQSWFGARTIRLSRIVFLDTS